MIQKPKGTYDLFGIDSKKLKYIEHLIDNLLEKYNYEYIRTPIFEASELFHRGIGDTTDIVTKETYDFVDKGNRNITLRPEGTAGVVRSLIENKLYIDLPKKYYYYGPMFRYERPQSGRNREFYQFGIEAFGSNDPRIDAEVISIAVTLYQLLGLKEIKVNINSLGNPSDRLVYKEALKNYFKPYLDELCPDCKNRFDKNPLRILDCKFDSENECMKNPPRSLDYLSLESKTFFEELKKNLTNLKIEYVINPSLVRGLDYYTHTVFEVEAKIEGFGSLNTLCGGGRYDSLSSTLDGPDCYGVGFAMGMERLLKAIDIEKIILPIDDPLDVFVIGITKEDKEVVDNITQLLRYNGFKVDTDYLGRNIKGQFKIADRYNSKYLVIIGEEERNKKTIKIKNNKTKEEKEIKLEELINYLTKVII